jgi:hypothetical protein
MPKILISGLTGVALLLAATVADAKPRRTCPIPGFPPRTLVVRGMECNDGLALVHRLFREHPGSYSVPPGRTAYFSVTGQAGTTKKVKRRFRCSVRYSGGTGSNRGGILLTVGCSDKSGDSLRYTEQQDNE